MPVPTEPAFGAASAPTSATHRSIVLDQFTRQAELFAKAPALHSQAALDLLVDTASPRGHEASLDVACGPGTVVAAFARRLRWAAGLDATSAMLQQARELAAEQGLENVEWHQGDVYALPFPDGAFDIVSCRFAFHHLQEPRRAFAEMLRVCRPGGRIVLCDATVSDDPAKAAAFNAMERHRDPSTVAFRPLGFLLALFERAGLANPGLAYYQVPAERERLIAASFPAGDDRERLRQMIDESVDGDRMGVNACWDGGTVKFQYPAVILVATKPTSPY